MKRIWTVQLDCGSTVPLGSLCFLESGTIWAHSNQYRCVDSGAPVEKVWGLAREKVGVLLGMGRVSQRGAQRRITARDADATERT